MHYNSMIKPPPKSEMKFEVFCWNIFNLSTFCQISAKYKAGFWQMFCGSPLGAETLYLLQLFSGIFLEVPALLHVEAN